VTSDGTTAMSAEAAATPEPAADGSWDEMGVRMVEGAPYSAALGLRYLSSSPGLGSILLPWRADLVGLEGRDVLAPGAVTALIDQTCGLAIISCFATRILPATLDLRIDHMRPAAPRTSVIASAHCYKVTRTIAFVRAEAWDASREDLVATAQAAFTLNRI